MEVEELIRELMVIRQAILDCEAGYESQIESVHPNYRYSARNFIRYLKLRTFELRHIQEQLSAMGLSSIGHSERYVLANIENILYFLHLYVGRKFQGRFDLGEHPVNYYKSIKVLEENTERLLGKTNQPFHTRIMVTLPTEAADDSALIESLLRAGMENARINCSHDCPAVWLRMIANIRTVSAKTGRDCKIYMDLPGPKLRTGSVENTNKSGKKPQDFIRLFTGDLLHVCYHDVPGTGASYDEKGQLLEPAKISISIPSIFQDVKVGERIWFDDGKIGGVIHEVTGDYLVVRITKTKPGGSKLRGEKGINLPDTRLNLPSLPDEDLAYLPFIVQHADAVGYSFVRTAADVELLQAELKRLNREDIGLVLKIENKEAFTNLPELLLTAMRSPNIGLMIARGDLAVELGPERISEVQEMLLWLCESAFIPNIWATQVLEKLAKEGIATRSEITDASMASRSECVMLNKGENILETVEILANILQRMEAHQYKKKGTLRPLAVASKFFRRNKV
ncbi:pyruvate kinase [Gaoshiqia sediminis]|uniref:Pyruvate kinase n=1 Tax=Gaoshiqia sediminis TaxID=2986998 RepID=A0AA41Y7E6_9BACT|nr:pyruvate kinase [Gaoshiqia sediminis]MCW0482482.1 pyruvate kinase [Gaoshiqia sediminis]